MNQLDFLYMDQQCPEAFATMWGDPRIGQVPIHITDEEHYKCTHYYERFSGDEITVNGVLNLLNFPENQPKKPYGQQQFFGCTKLSFILETIDRLNHEKCNLALAIVGSSLAIEQILMNILKLHTKFTCQSISSIYAPQSPPVNGVIMTFPRKLVMTSDINRNMVVDYTLVYDPSNKDIRQYSHFFQGVLYPKPIVLSLVCLRTADVRLCNYRRHYANKVNGNALMYKLHPDVFALFYNVRYTEINLKGKCILNKNVAAGLVAWMILKDGSQFDYQCTSYKTKLQQHQRQQRQQKKTYKRNSSGVKRCASNLNDPANAFQRKKLKEAVKPVEIPENHILSPETKRKIRARIQSSFPTSTLINKSLLLDEETVEGVGWLSACKISRSLPPSTAEKENKAVFVKNANDSKSDTNPVRTCTNIYSATPSSSSSSSTLPGNTGASSTSKTTKLQDNDGLPTINFKDKGKGRAIDIPPPPLPHQPLKRESSYCEMSEFEAELEAAHLELMRSLLGDRYDKQE